VRKTLTLVSAENLTIVCVRKTLTLASAENLTLFCEENPNLGVY
jgi:hypothetical protein